MIPPSLANLEIASSGLATIPSTIALKRTCPASPSSDNDRRRYTSNPAGVNSVLEKSEGSSEISHVERAEDIRIRTGYCPFGFEIDTVVS